MRNYYKNMISPTQRPKVESKGTKTAGKAYNSMERINRAMELLIHYNLTPIEIAYQLNYNSVEEFKKQFKNRVGLTPEHFKQLRVRDNLFRKK